MAEELDALITALGVTEPVILAGHSVGGLVARLYAARHRDRVAHLILVDATHEDYSRVLPRFDATIGTRDLWAQVARWQLRILGLYRLRVALGQVPGLRQEAEKEVAADLVEAHIACYLTTAFRRAVVQETLGFIFGMTPMRAQARDLGDLPITVVTAGQNGRDQWFEGWLQLQADFLTMSTDTRQVWARRADHHINHEHPDVLATVFLDAIQAAPAHPEL
jgi:pimeloyl-ACP methyl ester carboxylesterase